MNSKQNDRGERTDMNTTFANADEVEQAFIESGDLSMAVITASDDHLIIAVNADDQMFYQGIPMAEDEEGTVVDANHGWVEDLPHRAWPLALMVRADGGHP